MAVEIRKYENLTEQKWYNTKKDSNLFFRKEGYLKFFKDNKDFFEEYFEVSGNNGTYSVNFDSENLKIIKQKLNYYYKNVNIIFLKKNSLFDIEITENEYLKLEVKNERDKFTEYLFF